MRNAILSRLASDGALMALLAGGVHTATLISRATTPAAYDANRELLPCALLRFENEAQQEVYATAGGLIFVLYFYQRAGYDKIDAARERCYALLNRAILPGTQAWEVMHADDVLDQSDDTLAASMSLSRYQVMRLRG
jgi:hypothetical protein